MKKWKKGKGNGLDPRAFSEARMKAIVKRLFAKSAKVKKKKNKKRRNKKKRGPW